MTRQLLAGSLLQRLLALETDAAIQQLERFNCLQHAVDDYYEQIYDEYVRAAAETSSGGGGQTSKAVEKAPMFLKDHMMYTFLYNEVVRHQRADLLHWLLVSGPVHLESRLNARYFFHSPRELTLVSREEFDRAAEKWGLGSSLPPKLAAVLDESEKLVEIRDGLEARHREFADIFNNSGTVEEASTCCEAAAALVAKIPQNLREIPLFHWTHGRYQGSLVDMPARSPILRGRNNYGTSPLCAAAMHGRQGLFDWLCEINHPITEESDNDGSSRSAAYCRAFLLAAENGHVGLAKVCSRSWRLLQPNGCLMLLRARVWGGGVHSTLVMALLCAISYSL